MANIAGLRFLLGEAETRCSRLTDEAKALRFNIRAKGEFKVDLRRLLDSKVERRGVIEAEARTGEEMAE